MLNDSIKVRLIGGLGNQLFQYFAGMYVSQLTGKTLSVDLRWLDGSYTHSLSDIRNFKFFQPKEIITKESDGRINFPIERIKNRVSLDFPIFGEIFHIHNPKNPGYSDFTKKSTGKELRGYYQSFRYYEAIETKLGKINWDLSKYSEQYNKVLAELKKQPFIALHVRGGDYRKNRNIYHELKSEYYFQAISRLEKAIDVKKVVVFTDDLNYARELFYGSKVLFLDQSGLNASESMTLISMAMGIVIANSTFSFWSAVINGSNEIIAPKFWHKNIEIEDSFYPKNWRLI